MKCVNYFIAIFAMSILVIACDNGKQNSSIKDVQLNDATTSDTTIVTADKSEEQVSPNTSPTKLKNQPVTNNEDWDKKIIKTADIQLQLDDYKKFNTSIHTSLKNLGAYIAGEKESENDFKIENELTIKVPVANFEDLINSLQGEGIKTTEKNISTNDVTGEVVDTKARMLAKTTVRDKYMELLKQAKNMNEILQVQNEINSIQEDIEAANGRVNYLQHSSAFSTINLNYFQYVNGKTKENEQPDFFTKLSKAFSVGTSVITNIFLFCISIWPLIILAGLILFYSKKAKAKKLNSTKPVV